ncbi:MAG: hypothetical protein QM597_06120, partial [Aeromicrobium sp.]|uniref:hypothetical protein n=1 Tax=Aeromicrobium sp. TaxID=1871063 RepID=UPI0039E717DF
MAFVLVAVAAMIGVTAPQAHAVGVEDNVSPDTTDYSVNTANTYYAYVGEGEYVQWWAQGGTSTIVAPDGTVYSGAANGGISAPKQATGAKVGVWKVGAGGNQNWSFTVWDGNPGFGAVNPRTQTLATGVSEIPGRVWVTYYNIHQDDGTAKDINFWMLNDSGYQYNLGLTNYYGIDSVVSANSMGVPVGTAGADACTPSYRSWDGGGNSMACADPYRLFFEEPAADLPATATIWNQTTAQADTQVIAPSPVDETTLSASGFDFTPTSTTTSAGTFTYDLGDSFFGGHLLQIDVNNDGDYDDSVDRSIRVGAAGEPVEYEFDGLDGEGNAIEPCT